MKNAESKFTGTKDVSLEHRFDTQALKKYLSLQIPELRHDVNVKEFSGGQSNPTYLIETNSTNFVLRRKPPGETVRSAHAIDREFRVTAALYKAGYPVPEPLVLCEDESVIGTAFYIARFLKGRVFWDPELPALSSHERKLVYEEMSNVIAQLHNLDYKELGLSDFGREAGYVTRQIRRWSSQFLQSSFASNAVMNEVIDWLDDNMPTLEEKSRLIHGDFRLDNIIFHPEEPKIIGVIDWELSTLGNPLADIGYQCMQWRLPLEVFGGLKGVNRAAFGIPTEEEYLEIYRIKTGRREIPHWSFYIVYNMFRFAAILYGVRERVIQGTAANKEAKEMAGSAEIVAQEALMLVRAIDAGQVPR